MSLPPTTQSTAEPSRVAVLTFVGLALTFGIAQALLQAPTQVTDEGGHVGRSVRVAIGDWLPRRGDLFAPASPEMFAYMRHFYVRQLELRESVPEGELPVAAFSLAEYYATPAPLPRHDQGRQALLVGTARLNPEIGYLGQAAGLTVANWIDDSPALHFFSGRVGALLAATVITAWAISILPTGRWLFVFTALTPMVVVIRSSYSSDSMTVAFAFLAVALFTRARCRTNALRGAEFMALLATCIALGLLKANLILFPLIALLLPRDRFASDGARIAALAALFAIPALATFGWWNWVSVTDSNMVVTPAPVATEGVGTILPLLPRFLLESPGLLAEYGWKWIGQFVGHYWGSPGYRSLTIALPTPAIVLWLVLLATLIVTAPSHPRIRALPATAAALIATGLLLGTMFLFWLGPHLGGPIDHHISFMGGRYLHPALALTVPFAVGLRTIHGAPSANRRIAHRWIAIVGASAILSISLATNVRMNLGWPG